MSSQTPRGIRNNNPLNIKRGAAWIGRCVIQNDPIFVQFTNMRYGLRAAFMILRKYLQRGINTPATIIHTWAPDGADVEANYIKSVCNINDWDPDKIITDDEECMCALVYAMARVESASFLDMDVIRHAYRMKT